jgi:TolA-binding protein
MADKKNISKGAGLSREDIQRYAETSDQRMKHEIEMRSNESAFEQDAFDGWEAMKHDPAVMQRLDKRFKSSGFNFLTVGMAVVTVISIITAIYFWQNAQTERNETIASTEQTEQPDPSENITFTLDQEDVQLDEAIEVMIEAQEPEQIKVESILSEQKSIDSFQLAKFEADSLHKLELLPTSEVDKPEIPELIQSKTLGKEVYLNDLKLLDYRAYRSRPEIKTKQLVLTGTSADKESTAHEGQTSEWRDAEIPYIDYIDKTTRLFSKNNFKKALDRCETIIKTYPDDINALFYGGICLYNLKEYQRAIEYFSCVRNSDFSNFDEEAIWLIANCLERSGNSEMARAKYAQILKEGGFYAKQAQERLKK